MESEDAGDFARLSLLEAIEQASKLEEHRANVGVRLKALEEQMTATRSPEIKQALEGEIEAIKKTTSLMTQKIEGMAEFLRACTVTHDGVTICALDMMQVILTMRSQHRQLSDLLKGLNVIDFNMTSLVLAKKALGQQLQTTVDTWMLGMSTILAVMDSITVPENKSEIFESVWLKTQMKIHLVWDAKTQCFEKTKYVFGPELSYFVKRAATYFANAPSKTILIVNVVRNNDGGVDFKADVKPPPDYNPYYSTGGSTSG